LKVTVVGDTSVGKTSLLISYTTNTFPGEHVPTVFDNYSANAIVDGEPINLGLWDTAGSNEYDELRPLSYPGTDAFIVCYSIIDMTSLVSVEKRWWPEIKANCEGVPIILVGTKNDLRTKPDILERLKAEGAKPVSHDDGKRVADLVNAYKYIECSALTQENLQEVFLETIRSVINPKKEEKATGKKDEKPGKKDDGKGKRDDGKSKRDDGKGKKDDVKPKKEDPKPKKDDGKGKKDDGKGKKDDKKDAGKKK